MENAGQKCLCLKIVASLVPPSETSSKMSTLHKCTLSVGKRCQFRGLHVYTCDL